MMTMKILVVTSVAFISAGAFAGVRDAERRTTRSSKFFVATTAAKPVPACSLNPNDPYVAAPYTRLMEIDGLCYYTNAVETYWKAATDFCVKYYKGTVPTWDQLNANYKTLDANTMCGGDRWYQTYNDCVTFKWAKTTGETIKGTCHNGGYHCVFKKAQTK